MSTDPVADADRYTTETDDEDRRYNASKAFHKDNFLVAVMESPEQSGDSFPSSVNWSNTGCVLTTPKKKPTSEDVLLDEIDNAGARNEVAGILIQLSQATQGEGVGCPAITQLFDKLAESYARRRASIFDVE